MDIYTATEEAYKRGREAGFAEGSASGLNWHLGRDVPNTVERALLQKSGGRLYYLEGVYLHLSASAWNDVIAWAEIIPMQEPPMRE